MRPQRAPAALNLAASPTSLIARLLREPSRRIHVCGSSSATPFGLLRRTAASANLGRIFCDVWLSELEQEVRAIKWGRIDPATRILDPTEKDYVRDLGYDDDVEDALFALIDAGAKRDRQYAGIRLKLMRKVDGSARKFARFELLQDRIAIDMIPKLRTIVREAVPDRPEEIGKHTNVPVVGEGKSAAVVAIKTICEQFRIAGTADYDEPKTPRTKPKPTKRTPEEVRKEWIALNDEASWEHVQSFFDAAEKSGFVRGATGKGLPTLHVSKDRVGVVKLFNTQLPQCGVADSLHTLLRRAPHNDVRAAVETFRERLKELGGQEKSKGRIHLLASHAAAHTDAVIEAAKALEQALLECG